MSEKSAYRLLGSASTSRHSDEILHEYVHHRPTKTWIYLWSCLTVTLSLLVVGLSSQVHRLSREVACTGTTLQIGQSTADQGMDRPPSRLVEKLFVPESRYVKQAMLEDGKELQNAMARWDDLVNSG